MSFPRIRESRDGFVPDRISIHTPTVLLKAHDPLGMQTRIEASPNQRNASTSSTHPCQGNRGLNRKLLVSGNPSSSSIPQLLSQQRSVWSAFVQQILPASPPPSDTACSIC